MMDLALTPTLCKELCGLLVGASVIELLHRNQLLQHLLKLLAQSRVNQGKDSDPSQDGRVGRSEDTE
jgi:hypothetical protein